MPLERFKYEKRYWYPNLKTGETLLWERFLAKYPDYYDSVAYNVRVGQGREYPKELPTNILTDGKFLSQPKIDVVGFRGGIVDIVELKPVPRLNASAQLRGYWNLFIDTYPELKPNNLVLITYELTPDMKRALEGEEIDVIVV